EWEVDAIKRLQILGVIGRWKHSSTSNGTNKSIQTSPLNIENDSGKNNNTQDEIEFWKAPNSNKYAGVAIFQNAGENISFQSMSSNTPTDRISTYEKTSLSTPSPETVTSGSNNCLTPTNGERISTPRKQEINTNELVSLLKDHMVRQDRRLLASQKEIQYLRTTSGRSTSDLQTVTAFVKTLQKENENLKSQIHSATQMEFESLRNN
ncbi:12381_t:CDS:1, partial [Acaulospora morrowiae]